MRGSIVCGVDDSRSAEGAARVARELGERLGLPLVFVHVVEEGSARDEIDVVAARLRRVAARTKEGGDGRWVVESGHPADRLVAAAQAHDAVLVVVGSSGPRSSLLGSVSADVSRHAFCPVVVVAPGADRPLASWHAAAQPSSPSRFPGLAEDGYAGDVRPRDDQRELEGGIVRFTTGGARR